MRNELVLNSRRRCVVGVALFACASLACSQSRSSTVAIGGLGPEISYTLRLHDGLPRSVEVTVQARGGSDGRTVFAVAEEWGGVRADDRNFLELRVTGDDGKPLTVEHPVSHQWIVRHPPNEPLVLTYTLRQPGDRTPAEHANDYRPIITDRLFHVIGNHGLVAPEHLQDKKVRIVELCWRGFAEAGWKTVSSHGPGNAMVSMPLEEFRHALFLAGDIRLHQRDIRGGTLAVSVHGDWSFGDAEFVDLVERIVSMERAFFNDFTDPWYLVSIIPSGPSDPGSLSLGGTGLTNCFAFFASPNASLSPDGPGSDQLKRVLAHEYFHRWNGGRIDFPEPEQAVYWFSEGFTDFYARRLLLRSSLWTPAQYAEDLNDSIKNYCLSPARDAPNEHIVTSFWKDPNFGSLPYRRGDLIALVLDEAIRSKTGGRRSLDDLIRELLAGGSSERALLTNESLISRFAAEAGADVAEQIRRCIIDGAEIPLPSHVSEPELVQSARQVGAFDLGFDLDASRAAKEIQGVRLEGPAHRAGLRDGQRLLGMSVHFGQSDHPAELTIEHNGARTDIRYIPCGPTLEVPVFYAAHAAATGD